MRKIVIIVLVVILVGLGGLALFRSTQNNAPGFLQLNAQIPAISISLADQSDTLNLALTKTLKPGSYTVKASKSGYLSQQYLVQISPKKTTVVDINLISLTDQLLIDSLQTTYPGLVRQKNDNAPYYISGLKYFEGNTWAVVQVNPNSSNGQLSRVVVRVNNYAWVTVAGPGTDFSDTQSKNSMPSEVYSALVEENL